MTSPQPPPTGHPMGVVSARLSARLYVLALVAGVVLGALPGLAIADSVARSAATRSAGGSFARPGESYESHRATYDAAYRASFAPTAALAAALGTLAVSAAMFLLGRRNLPARVDANGLVAWGWVGTVQHRWADLRDRSVLVVSGADRIERFHFAGGDVAVSRTKLANAGDVLAAFHAYAPRR
ncbi:MAG: hypothetical protein R3A48_24545 [Polyangiales bacterium]